MDKLPVSDLAQ